MKGNPASKALNIIVAVLGVVLVLGAMTFAGPCVHDDGSTSMCRTAQIAIIAGGVAAAVLSVASLLVGNSKAVGVLSIVAAACGVFVAVAPGNAFPLCMMATMHCRLVMQPFAQFAGIAIAVVSLIAGVRALRMRS